VSGIKASYYVVPLDHILYAYIFLLWNSKLYSKRNTI